MKETIWNYSTLLLCSDVTFNLSTIKLHYKIISNIDCNSNLS